MRLKRPNERGSGMDSARSAFIHEVGICAVTGRTEDIECAHIRGADWMFNKPLSGMKEKPHWIWTLPLTREKHVLQHQSSEAEFWTRHGYPWRDISRGPMAAALILQGFHALNDPEGARRWLRERVTVNFQVVP